LEFGGKATARVVAPVAYTISKITDKPNVPYIRPNRIFQPGYGFDEGFVQPFQKTTAPEPHEWTVLGLLGGSTTMVGFNYAVKSWEPVKQGVGEVVASYGAFGLVAATSVAYEAAAYTKDPTLISQDVAKIGAAIVVGKIASLAIGGVYRKIAGDKKPTSIYMSKQEYDKLNKDWASRKAIVEADILKDDAAMRSATVKSWMVTSGDALKGRTGFWETARGTIVQKADEKLFMMTKGYENPSTYYNVKFKIGQTHTAINDALGKGPLKSGSELWKPPPAGSIPVENIGQTTGIFTKTDYFKVPAPSSGSGGVVQANIFATTSFDIPTATQNVFGVLSSTYSVLPESQRIQDQPSFTADFRPSLDRINILPDQKRLTGMTLSEERRIRLVEMEKSDEAVRYALRNPTKQELLEEYREGLRLGIGVKTRLRTPERQRSGQRERERVLVIDRINIGEIVHERVQTGQRVDVIQIQEQPKPPPPGETFLFPPLFGDVRERYGKKKKKKKLRGPVRIGAPPDLTAALLGIRGKKVSKVALATGIGVRPYTKGWMRKTKSVF